MSSAAAARRTWRLIGPDSRPYWSDNPGTLGGHRGTRVYGRLDCPSALRAIARGGYVTSRVFFADEATAIAAGYRPCATCLRAAYSHWKLEQTAGLRRYADRRTDQRAERPFADPGGESRAASACLSAQTLSAVSGR